MLAVLVYYFSFFKLLQFCWKNLQPNVWGHHSRYLHFYDMAFVLRSDALPATNPLFRWKTGPPDFHINVGASHSVSCPKAQQANLPACSPQSPLNAECQAGKLGILFFKVFWYDSTRGMNPKSSDCKADTLTTTPLHWFSL